MLRIDRTFKNRLVKWTIILSIILEVIMVVINFPNIWEILEYCGMGLVIIFFVIFTEIKGLAFCLRYGLIQYIDTAEKDAKENIESANEILAKRMEELENKIDNEEKSEEQ